MEEGIGREEEVGETETEGETEAEAEREEGEDTPDMTSQKVPAPKTKSTTFPMYRKFTPQWCNVSTTPPISPPPPPPQPPPQPLFTLPINFSPASFTRSLMSCSVAFLISSLISPFSGSQQTKPEKLSEQSPLSLHPSPSPPHPTPVKYSFRNN